MTSTTAALDPRRWRALGVLAAGLAMIVLDGTIVSVSLPTIVADLHLDLAAVQWVSSLYAVVVAALLLTLGRTGDQFGRRRLFVAGLALFVIGSTAAALSNGESSLIASRALQGVGGAMVMPSTLSTVNALFQGKERAAAFGVWGATMSGTAALGPLLGGWLTSTFTWQWIFWVNVPIGLILIALAFALVPETTARRDAGRQDHRLDLGGLLLSALGFGLTIFGLIEATTLGWTTPSAALTIGPLTWPISAPISAAPIAIALGVLSLIAFVLTEIRRARRGQAVLLNPNLFRIGSFGWGNLTALTVAIGEFALLFVLPLFLVIANGLTTMEAGWVLAAMALGAFGSGASARHLVERLGGVGVVALGLALEVIGTAATAVVVQFSAGTATLVVALIVYGVGLGLASAQLTSTVLFEVPVEISGAGSATQSTIRQLGSALGAAVSGSVLAVWVPNLQQRPDPSLVEAFSTGAGASIWVAVGFLTVGLASTALLARSSRRRGEVAGEPRSGTFAATARHR